MAAEVMQALAMIFSDHKQGRQSKWQQGEQLATEELRVSNSTVPIVLQPIADERTAFP
ncbi:hypothetical protein GTW98_16290 [Streptomyces sp. SID8375]|uniref:hypothetical protein n=1 Tax=unclassified Streptomyces TaxID=2593676 RepID=UPI00131A0FFF|nr:MULTISPECIES: hypothetical protein [unclassified Streptomyces]MYX08340.1 hypothetical protein [Streptomyces sp. SID8375]